MNPPSVNTKTVLSDREYMSWCYEFFSAPESKATTDLNSRLLRAL